MHSTLQTQPFEDPLEVEERFDDVVDPLLPLEGMEVPHPRVSSQTKPYATIADFQPSRTTQRTAAALRQKSQLSH